jgi:predicted chitinase
MPQFYKINLNITAEDSTKVSLLDYVYQFGGADDNLTVNLPKEILAEYKSSPFKVTENPSNRFYPNKADEYSKVTTNNALITISLTYDYKKIESDKSGFDSHYNKVKSIIENAFKSSSTKKTDIAAKVDFQIIGTDAFDEKPPQTQTKTPPPLEDQLSKFGSTVGDLIKAVRVRPVASSGIIPKGPGLTDGKVFLVRKDKKDLRIAGLSSPDMVDFYGTGVTVVNIEKSQSDTTKYDQLIKNFINQINFLGKQVEIIQDPFDENVIPPDNNIVNIGAKEIEYQVKATLLPIPEPPPPTIVEEPLPESTPEGNEQLEQPSPEAPQEQSREERTGQNPNDSTEKTQDRPTTPGITNVFSPQAKAKQIKFDATTDQETQRQTKESLGNFPFIWYNSYQIAVTDVSYFHLYMSNNLPTVKIVFRDSLNKMKDQGFPLDDTKISVFLNPRTTQLKPIHMDFKIVNFQVDEPTYTVTGVLDVSKLYVKEFKSYSNISSYKVLTQIAKDTGLGFNSNINDTNDAMTWINPGERVYEFLNKIIDSSYLSDESFILGYVDYYYNYNFVDLEKELSRDLKQELGIANVGIEEITQTQKKEGVSNLFITNDYSMNSSNSFFESYRIINNSTSISIRQGYLTKVKFYDEIQKDYLVFDIDSITTKGDTKIILKGAPQDESFFKENYNTIYTGKLDTDNMHKNYHYSLIQNDRNIIDLQKIALEVVMHTPNYNVYKFQKIFVFISNQASTPSTSHVNNRLTGEWLIVDIQFTFDGESYRQVLKLIKRELDLSPEELRNEAPQESTKPKGENTSNDNTTGSNENPVAEEVPATPNQANQTVDDDFPLTKDMFRQYFRKVNGIYGLSAKTLEVLYEPFKEEMKKYKIDTPKRISAFLGVISTETGNLQNVSELSSGNQYEGRSDLGNTVTGDGVKYKGRGLIQLTGRALYKKTGDDVGKSLVNNPTAVASDNQTWRRGAASDEQVTNSILTATRYFAKGSTWGDLRTYADKMDLTKPLDIGSFSIEDLPNTVGEANNFGGKYGRKKERNFATSFPKRDTNLYNYMIIQFGVNGGYNGFRERCINWDRARKFFI